MAFDVETAFESIKETMSTIHADNKVRFEKLEDKVGTVLTDIAIIKNMNTDFKKDIYGNGTPGMKTRLTQTEERLVSVTSIADDANTNALAAKGKVDKIEGKIGRFIGIVVGGNFIIAVLFAILINWDKIQVVIPKH